MFDFECHYREEGWQTARYFDFVKEFLIAAQSSGDSDDCDPPPCPTTPQTVTALDTFQGEWARDSFLPKGPRSRLNANLDRFLRFEPSVCEKSTAFTSE